MVNYSFKINAKQEEDKLLAFFRRRSAIAVYFQAVLNAELVSFNPAEKPSWYDKLNTSLGTLKGYAQKWSNIQAPALTAIPQTYINFANTYQGQYDLLTGLMNQLIESSSDNTDTILNQITTVMDFLADAAQKQQTALASLDKSLQSYLALVKGDIGDLTSGASSVRHAITDENDKVTEITNHISNLQRQLQADMTAAESAGIAATGSLIGFIITIGIVIVDPSAGAIAGAVIAGVGLGAAAIVANISEDSIIEDQKEILEKQQELSAASKEVLVLQGVSLTVKALLNTYDESKFTMSDFTKTWGTLYSNLIHTKNQVIDQRGYKEGLQSILSDMENLQNTMHRLSDYCTNLQDNALHADSAQIKTLAVAAAA